MEFIKNNWVGLAINLITPIILLVWGAFRSKGILPLFRTLKSIFRLHKRLSSIRLTRFVRDRADYRDRLDAKGNRVDGIANYVASAKSELIIVGINLLTGNTFDDIKNTIKELVDRGVVVTISLIDPRSKGAKVSISQALGKNIEELEVSIREALDQLLVLKSSFDRHKMDKLHVWLHKTVPFASAIIIDPESTSGEIQIETKPYGVNLTQSFGFTLGAGGQHPLYRTLVDAYRSLIAAGEEVRRIEDKYA